MTYIERLIFIAEENGITLTPEKLQELNSLQNQINEIEEKIRKNLEIMGIPGSYIE